MLGAILAVAALATTVLVLSDTKAPIPASDEAVSDAVVRAGVSLRPFRAALSEAAEGVIAFAPKGTEEAGVELSPASPPKSKRAGRVAVFFDLDASAPFNIREDGDGDRRYSSSTARQHVILNLSEMSSALIYSQGYDAASIRIVGVEPCDGIALICEADGSVVRPIRLTKSAPALSATAYNGADISVAEKSGHIDVSRREGFEGEFGVRLGLAPAKAARRVAIIFDRTPPQGVSLSRRNRQGLAYLPMERRHVVLEPGDEALFFAGSDDRFSVKLESVSACASDNWRCRTREEFEELLPQADVNATKFERALQLLQWASKNIDYALTRSIANEFKPARNELHKTYFRYFASDAGGGYCGGTSVFFAGLLRAQGIEAFTWNFGDAKNQLTHVTTVVPIDGRFYMLDATFGSYLVKPGTTEPLDLFAYIGGAPYDFHALSMSGRRFVAKRNEMKVFSQHIKSGILIDCRNNISVGTVSCQEPIFGLERYLSNFSKRLANAGLSPDKTAIRALMLRGTFSVAGGRVTPETKAFVMKLKEYDVPFVDVPGSPSPEDMLN